MRASLNLVLLAVLGCAACSGGAADDVSLAGLSPSVGALQPDFSPAETRYALQVPSWIQSVRFTPSVTAAGATIQVNGAAVATGAPSADVPISVGTSTVKIDVVAASGTRRSYEVAVTRNEQKIFYLKASNTGAGDNFGRAVSLSGDLLAVGAPQEDSNAAGVNGDQGNNGLMNSGAVYVFRWDGTTWTQEAYLKPSDPKVGAQFGTRVSLSGDTLAVGTLIADVAYVFRRSGGAWSQEARLVASNREAGDAFGRVVSLSGDTLAITAELEASAATGVNGDQSDNSAPGSGAVYVFRRKDNAWTQEAYLKSAKTARMLGQPPQFGITVSLDGDLLAVNALQESTTYLFRRTGSAWAQEAAIDLIEDSPMSTGVAVSGDTAFVSFGQSSQIYRRKDNAWRKEASIDVNRNGFPSLVGGALVTGLATFDGAPVYRRDEAGMWRKETSLAPPAGGSAGSFGGTCSMSGSMVAVGAQSDNSGATGVGGDAKDMGASASGAVFVFR